MKLITNQFVILKSLTGCAFLKTLTPVLYRSKKRAKTTIRDRVEGIRFHHGQRKSVNNTSTLSRTVLLLTALTPGLCAAQAPDTGQILRQQEQINPSIDRLPPPKTPEPEALAPPEKGVSIIVKSIIINGGEALESNEVLQSLVADAIGQSLGSKDLNEDRPIDLDAPCQCREIGGQHCRQPRYISSGNLGCFVDVNRSSRGRLDRVEIIRNAVSA